MTMKYALYYGDLDNGQSKAGYYYFHSTSRECYKHVKQNLAMVDVHISPAMATRVTTTLRVTRSEQLANFGLFLRHFSPLLLI